MRSGFFLIILVFGLFSCTIKQEYNFKNNGNGSYKLIIDLSATQSFAKGLTPNDGEGESKGLLDEDQKKEMDSTLNVLNLIPGISNSFMNEKDGAVQIGYDFESVNVLNQSLGSDFLGSNYNSTRDSPSIVLSSKKFKLTSPDLGEEESLKQAGMMAKMIIMETRITFESKKIKKCKNSKAKISEDKSSVTLTYNLEEVFRKEVDANLELKFK